LWLSESRAGIYYGIFATDFDVHQSYHTDGTRHMRVGKEHHQRFRDLPLAQHKGSKQLTHHGLGPDGADAPFRPHHQTSRGFDSVEIIDKSALLDSERLAVEIWLSDHDSLGRLDAQLNARSSAWPDCRLIFTSSLRLTHFPGLWISAVVIGMTDPNESSAVA
jgi:hypothetical protein